MSTEAASGTLAEADRLGPAVNGPAPEPSRARDAAWPPKETSLSSYHAAVHGRCSLWVPSEPTAFVFPTFMS